MKILIAEDERATRSYLTAMSQKWGFEPIAVEDGDAAMKILHYPDPPRLLLFDWELWDV